jgi:hypothetical protein
MPKQLWRSIAATAIHGARGGRVRGGPNLGLLAER